MCLLRYPAARHPLLPSIQEQAAALAGDVITDQASRLVLSGLGLDALPDVLLSAKHDRLSVLQLQRNTLALLPSELFLNLKGLQEMDVSKVLNHDLSLKTLLLKWWKQDISSMI